MLKVNTEHPTANHGGGSQQSHTLHVNYTCGKCLSYNASLYCLWLHSPPSASPAAQQNQNLIMGCFSKKGQHAKPYALLAILYKDTTPCAGQMEGCWGSVSDPLLTLVRFSLTLLPCVCPQPGVNPGSTY